MFLIYYVIEYLFDSYSSGILSFVLTRTNHLFLLFMDQPWMSNNLCFGGPHYCPYFFILFYFSLCKRYCFVEFHKTHSFTFPSMNHLLGSNLSWSVHYVITYNCQSQPFWFRIQGSHLASWSHFLSFFALVKITHRYCMINDSLSGFDLRSITLFFHLHT